MTMEKQLFDLMLKWEEQARYNGGDPYQYRFFLDEILFQAEMRFGDYRQYSKEGRFVVRLTNWLDNVSKDVEKKSLMKLIPSLSFIDRRQMLALCRDAYRRVITPWMSEGFFTADDLVAADYGTKVRTELGNYLLFSITDSFSFPDFIHENDLSGIPKPKNFRENPDNVAKLVPGKSTPKGVIVFEDFVGTGNQAKSVLSELCRCAPNDWKILFVPLIILERGLSNLSGDSNLGRIEVRPVLVVPNDTCIEENSKSGEPSEFGFIRAVVKSTAARVKRPLPPSDDPPGDPFGYGGCGAVVVTSHNTPNNTLPLIHHRAPNWVPLFRRVHHSKDGL